MFETALLEAKALDKEFAVTGRIRGPLHGVPVSFKDQCMPISFYDFIDSILTETLKTGSKVPTLPLALPGPYSLLITHFLVLISTAASLVNQPSEEDAAVI